MVFDSHLKMGHKFSAQKTVNFAVLFDFNLAALNVRITRYYKQ
jgi:hypothetical protein